MAWDFVEKVVSFINLEKRQAYDTASTDPCTALRTLAEFGTRDEKMIRELAIGATRFLVQDTTTERVREAIVDLILRIELECILGGPVDQLRAKLFRILDLIVSKYPASREPETPQA